MNTDMNFVTLTWIDIEEICRDITKQITDKKWEFDTIISVGRGGMIPARILSDMLSIPTVYMYNIKLYKGIGDRHNRPTTESFNYNIEKKRVLLVDDILDSGITIEHVYNNLQNNRTSELKIATLFCKSHATNKPTFFARLCEADDWIIFPWEKTESN